MAAVRAKDKSRRTWDESTSKSNYNGARRKNASFDTKSHRQEAYPKNMHNKYKQEPIRERHHSNFSDDNHWKSSSSVVNDSLWDDNEMHFPALGEAPVPKVNVWEERKAKAEMIKAIQPKNENDEEAMLQWAIELSKREAEEEEETRRIMEEQCKLQEEALKINPEFLEGISDLEDNGLTSDFSQLNQPLAYSLKKEDTWLPTVDISGSRKGQIHSNVKNLEGHESNDTKITKIIDCFGGWGLNAKSSASNNMSDFVDSVIEKNSVIEKQHPTFKSGHTSQKEVMKSKCNGSSIRLEKGETKKPIASVEVEKSEILSEAEVPFTDQYNKKENDGSITVISQDGFSCDKHSLTDIVECVDANVELPVLKNCEDRQNKDLRLLLTNKLIDKNVEAHQLSSDNTGSIGAIDTKASCEYNGVLPSPDFETQKHSFGDIVYKSAGTERYPVECSKISSPSNGPKTNISPEHETLNISFNEGKPTKLSVFENNIVIESKIDDLEAADHTLDNDVADPESPPILPPKPVSLSSHISDFAANPQHGANSFPQNLKNSTVPMCDSALSNQIGAPFVPLQYPIQAQLPLMNPFLTNFNMYAGLMNMNMMMGCTYDPIFMLRNPHLAQVFAMENYYKGIFPTQPQMSTNLNPELLGDIQAGNVSSSSRQELPDHTPNTNQKQPLPPGLCKGAFHSDVETKRSLDNDWLDSILSSNSSCDIPPPKPAADPSTGSASAVKPSDESSDFVSERNTEGDADSHEFSSTHQASITKTQVTGWGDLEDDSLGTQYSNFVDSWSEEYLSSQPLKNSSKTIDTNKPKPVFRQPASKPQFSQYQRR